MTHIVTDLNEWRNLRQKLNNKSIGFVPTMGNLHVGHISLCERARAENEITVASIFVNPTQFNQMSDFDSYPRSIEEDEQFLRAANIDYLLMPTQQDMYPDRFQLQVSENKLALELEGRHRSGHFTGMLTVVLKLLNLVQATKAYFGEKDYQQYLLVKKMAEALFLNTEIVACPTVRAKDGLALSSRNSRLSASERQQAAAFPRILQNAVSAALAEEQLIAEGFKVDYVAEQWGRRLAAVWLGDVRLIDNFEV